MLWRADFFKKNKVLIVVLFLLLISGISAGGFAIYNSNLKREKPKPEVLSAIVEASSESSFSSESSASSSSSFVSSISSLSSSSIAVSSVVSKAPIPVNTTGTYTNPNFPKFRLVYDNSWKFSTSTKPDPYLPSISNRNISLVKNGVQLSIDTFVMPDLYGCQALEVWNKNKTFTANFHKYINLDGTKVQYSNIADCAPTNILTTNLNPSDYPGYGKRELSPDGKIILGFEIKVTGNYKPTDPIISEIDKIFSNSKLE